MHGSRRDGYDRLFSAIAQDKLGNHVLAVANGAYATLAAVQRLNASSSGNGGSTQGGTRRVCDDAPERAVGDVLKKISSLARA